VINVFPITFFCLTCLHHLGSCRISRCPFLLLCRRLVVVIIFFSIITRHLSITSCLFCYLFRLAHMLFTCLLAFSLSTGGSRIFGRAKGFYGCRRQVSLTSSLFTLRRWLTAFGTPFLLGPVLKASL